MDDIGLLLFRWGTEKYGISVEDVIGITDRSWVHSMAYSGQSTPILGMQASLETGDNKQAIIMYTNGVQIAIIVDEVIKITSLMDDVVPGATRATFNIWHF